MYSLILEFLTLCSLFRSASSMLVFACLEQNDFIRISEAQVILT